MPRHVLGGRGFTAPSDLLNVALIGAGSHAWVEALIDGYWRGFDPTHGVMLEHQPYIKIAHGRDFFDCRLNRGVFIGKSQQNLYVNVTVARDEQQ